jgi:putative hydroxymethylpyrimidine transport system substrate-binding protein
MLDWVPNPDQVGFYYAYENGYFERAGLDVKVEVPSQSYAETLVGANKVDLGISYPGGEYSAELAKIPIEGVATSIPNTLDAIIISPNAGITGLKGLAGKTVGYAGTTGEKNLKYLLTKDGVNPNSVKFIEVGSSIVPALISGKVDAITGGLINVEAIEIAQQLHKKPIVLDLTQEGYPPYPEFTIIANKNRLASSPVYRSEVKDFLSAFVAGSQAAVKHPAQAEAVLAKVTQYQPVFLKQSVPLTLQNLIPPPGQNWGCFNLPEMQTLANFFDAHGIITGKLTVTNWLTNAYLPESCSS